MTKLTDHHTIWYPLLHFRFNQRFYTLDSFPIGPLVAALQFTRDCEHRQRRRVQRHLSMFWGLYIDIGTIERQPDGYVGRAFVPTNISLISSAARGHCSNVVMELKASQYQVSLWMTARSLFVEQHKRWFTYHSLNWILWSTLMVLCPRWGCWYLLKHCLLALNRLIEIQTMALIKKRVFLLHSNYWMGPLTLFCLQQIQILNSCHFWAV